MNVTDGSIIPFNDDSAGDSFDTDSNYNTSTYKYTAPATGDIFWYEYLYANSDDSNGFWFLKNSTKVDLPEFN